MSTERQLALEQLDFFLSACNPTVSDLKTCTPAPLDGVTVHTNVLSQEVIELVHEHLASAIVAMNPSAQHDGIPLSDTVLAQGVLDLGVFNPYRCFKNNFGNLDFAYLFLRSLDKDKYAKVKIDNQDVLFDINTVYSHVTLPMLLHPDSEKLLETIWMLGGDKSVPRMVSWDSIKLANRPAKKPASMTLQQLTQPHMDIYDDHLGRIQSIINLDHMQHGATDVVSYYKPYLGQTEVGGTKLFYVPGTEHPIAKDLIRIISGNSKLYYRHGYVAVRDPDLLKIFIKHAVAAPYNSMVSWPSQVIHFEAKAGKLITSGLRKGLYSCKGIIQTQNSIRLRIPVGTQSTGKVSQSGMKKLGLLALRSFIPAVYFNPNRDNEVGNITVALKTTQKRETRELSVIDRVKIEEVEKEAETWTDETFDSLVTNQSLRRLLGVWDTQ